MAKRKRRTPPRGRGGRFIKRRSAAARANPANPRRRHRRRHAARAAAPRRRHYRRNPANPRRRHRRYRRNPMSLAGFGLNQSTLRSVGLTAAGLIGTPFVEGLVNQYVPQPADPTAAKFVKYGVKIGSAVVLGFAANKLLGKDAGRAVLVGAGAYVAISAINDFFPNLLGSSAPAVSGAGYQPQLGAYVDTGLGSYMTDDVPERLRPQSRF